MMEWDELQIWADCSAQELTHASHGLAHYIRKISIYMHAGSYKHSSGARSMPSVLLRYRYFRVDIRKIDMQGQANVQGRYILQTKGGSMLPFTCKKH
jgi:hypothetical protein